MAQKCENSAGTDKLVEQVAEEAGKVINLPAVKEFIPTGCTVLNFAVANCFPGGVPVGRIVHVYGGTSTCKTVLAVTICGYNQRLGRKSYYGDVEHTLDPAFAEIYGLNCSDEETFEIGYPIALEGLFDDYIAEILLKQGKKKAWSKSLRKGEKKTVLNADSKIIAVDSITALPSDVEMQEAMVNGTYGTSRAKQMSRGLRKYIFPFAESNTTLLCIDQTRDNIGSPFGGETTSGGRALEFYSSVQIYLKMDKKIKNPSGRVIGHWVKFRIDKNKVAPPFREGRFRILFDYGLDDVATSIYFISEQQNGPQKAQNKTQKIRIFEEEKDFGSWIRYIESENLEEDLCREVWGIWQKVYETERRKARVW